MDELKVVTQIRRREADLQTLESEVSGHENRLNMTKRSREIAVSTCVDCGLLNKYTYMYYNTRMI